jgi:hypothetical protein
MNKQPIAIFLTLGMISWALAGRSTAIDRLLQRLRAERQTAVLNPSRLTARKPAIDLKQLRGVSRDELIHTLGAPDFCALPEDASCMNSTRVAYFYYPPLPPAKDDEVVVRAGGGWALELFFARDSVDRASWVKQE